MTGALPVARWGSADLRQALLPGVASGELILTAALREPSDPAPAIAAGWAAIAGSGWAGRSALAGAASARWSSRSSRTRRPAPTCRCPPGTLQTVGPALQEHGTPGQQDFFLPKILAREMHFAIGYTEPQACPDLAALRTRAVRVGETTSSTGRRSSPPAPSWSRAWTGPATFRTGRP